MNQEETVIWTAVYVAAIFRGANGTVARSMADDAVQAYKARK